MYFLQGQDPLTVSVDLRTELLLHLTCPSPNALSLTSRETDLITLGFQGANNCPCKI